MTTRSVLFFFLLTVVNMCYVFYWKIVKNDASISHLSKCFVWEKEVFEQRDFRESLLI